MIAHFVMLAFPVLPADSFFVFSDSWLSFMLIGVNKGPCKTVASLDQIPYSKHYERLGVCIGNKTTL